jgi:hypothetical protein
VLPLYSVPPADVVLFAHPITQSFNLPLSPLVVAVGASAGVLVVALAWPGRAEPVPDATHVGSASWADGLTRPQIATRAVGVALLALAISAGRLGVDDQLENLAPALVIGAAWPVLVFVSVVIGPIWRWLDPWDALARVLARGETERPFGHVWPAAALALPWVWYLGAYPDSLEPRSVGALLALYTLVTLAGCLAVGRERWLASSEPFGIVLAWLALVPRRLLSSWRAPPGAETLLGVLAGGVLFGAVRRSELWGELNVVSNALLWATLGVVVSCVVVAGLLEGMARAAYRGRSGVARAAVPALAGIIVAVAMDFNRLFTSLQLLPRLLGDPFGKGWDPFGTSGAGLDPAPLGTTGLTVAQLAVLLAAHVAGAVALARGVPRGDRGPGAVAVTILAAASVIAIATH